MTRPLLIGAALSLSLAALEAAPKGKYSRIGELPGEKAPEVLQPRERNPFARREAKTDAPAVEQESEESKLRALIATMNVTGVVRGGDAPTVLLEDLILKPGHPIPALLEDQTEKLAVGRITEAQVEILFVEAEPTAEPRKIFIPIDLKPRFPPNRSAVSAAEKSAR